MNYPLRLKPALAIVALASSLFVANANAARADRCTPCACHPAAEAHMKAAIRVMTLAPYKPSRVRRKLGLLAGKHLFLAQRFTRRPGAQAELCAAMTTLAQLTQAECVPLFDPAIQQTQLAMYLECNPGYNPRLPVAPGYTDAPWQPVHPGYTHGRVDSFGRGHAGPTVSPQPPGRYAIPHSSQTGPQEF